MGLLQVVAGWWVRYEQKFGAWASILGLILFLGGWAMGWLAQTSTVNEVIYCSGFVLLSMGGFITFLVFSIRYSRKARYAEALLNLREAVRKTTEESLRTHTIEEKKEALASVMDQLSSAFSILTGSSCRACVKVVRGRKDGKDGETLLQVATLCRNTAESELGDAYPLEFNTDFNDLYQSPSVKWFFGNNLPLLASKGKYSNTNHSWQSRYRSTLVWPIRMPTPASQTDPELLGFLCVDSKRTQPFSEEFDYPIGAIVADTLYPFLKKLVNSVPSPTDEVKVARISTDDVADRVVREEGASGKHVR